MAHPTRSRYEGMHVFISHRYLATPSRARARVAARYSALRRVCTLARPPGTSRPQRVCSMHARDSPALRWRRRERVLISLAERAHEWSVCADRINATRYLGERNTKKEREINNRDSKDIISEIVRGKRVGRDDNAGMRWIRGAVCEDNLRGSRDIACFILPRCN